MAGSRISPRFKPAPIRELRRQFSPEQIKRATMHSTNQAFERYFQMEGDDLREIYAGTRADKTLIRQSGDPRKANLLIFKGRIGGADGTRTRALRLDRPAL